MVDAHVHAEDHARLQQAASAVHVHHVVDVIAHMVGPAVPHIGADVLEPGADPGVPELFKVEAADLLVHMAHGQAGLQGGEHVVGGVEGALIEELLPVGELAVQRPAAGDVVDLAVPAGSHVVEHHIPVVGLPLVAVVVDAEVVLPRRHDGGEARCQDAPLGQGVVELRLELVLHDAVPGGAHHGLDALGGDGLGVAHGLDLAGLLDGPLVPDEAVDVLHPDGGVVLPEPGRKLERLPHRLFVHLPAVQVQADRGEAPVDHPLQIGEEGRVGPDVPHGGEGFGLLGAQAAAHPALGVGVGREHEQLLAGAPAGVLHRHQHALRLLDAGIVEEGAVGEEGVVLVAGLPGGAAAEEEQHAPGGQGAVELLPVLLVECFFHDGYLHTIKYVADRCKTGLTFRCVFIIMNLTSQVNRQV